MRLANFIRANVENISAEWEKFAATLLPNEEFSSSVLRDGIAPIMREIAKDMDHFQSAAQQQEKSEGEQTHDPDKDNAAETHALARVNMGLSSRQLISEFRALRASVLRLWDESDHAFDKQDIYDITRFNEAIDQALTEAAVRYLEKVEQSRELFLGILGHDLRNPLAAISGFADLIIRGKKVERNVEFASRISMSVSRMALMITDLIELTRIQSGAGITVNPTEIDMQKTCAQVLAEMRAIYPERNFQLICDDSLLGKWDEPRISQVLSNLLGNAIQHGSAGSAVTVTAKTVNGGIEISVHNGGTAVPPELLPTLFDRFVQVKSGSTTDESQSSSLGLGLYIAKEIVAAHGGTIAVQSTDTEGTTFTAWLPLAPG